MKRFMLICVALLFVGVLRAEVPKEIAELLKKAEAGDAAAQLQLGYVYNFGDRGVPEDLGQAIRWYRKAGENGNGRALFHLGILFSFYRKAGGDDAEVLKCFKQSAEYGEVMAALKLGRLYYEGVWPAKKDDEEAKKWYDLAASLSAPEQQKAIADMFSFGNGGPASTALGIKWQRVLAEVGNADSQFITGLSLAAGDGVPKDMNEAVKWYRLAAEQGHAAAQLNLGAIYGNGDGVSKDAVESVKWNRKAAEQGLLSAQLNLGSMYWKGEGVPKDAVEAHAWWNVAGARGDEQARKDLTIIEKQMTKEQIAEATKLARERFEKYGKKK